MLDTNFDKEMPNDILRTVYRMAVHLRDRDIYNSKVCEVANKILTDISTNITARVTVGFYSDVFNLTNLHGFIRTYGMGHIVTLDFADRTVNAVLKIKQNDGVYVITDYECTADNVFALHVVDSLVSQFNEQLVLVNKRRPTRAWIQMQLRDKIIEDLAMTTKISVYRLERILDS